jgi:hypothetical protein
MSKRSFGVDTSSLSTEAPVIDNNFYAAQLTGASIENKDHKSFFKVQEEKKWNKTDKVMELTGDWVVSGMLMFSVILTSKLAIKRLQRDEPRIFGSPIFIRFDKKTYQMLDNPVLGQILEVFDLGGTDFDELVDFEEDDNIAVPPELADVEDIVKKLNAVEYYKALFTLICQSISDLPCRVKIIKRPMRDNPNTQENVIDLSNTFCGLLSYTDGCEEDLEE